MNRNVTPFVNCLLPRMVMLDMPDNNKSMRQICV